MRSAKLELNLAKRMQRTVQNTTCQLGASAYTIVSLTSEWTEVIFTDPPLFDLIQRVVDIHITWLRPCMIQDCTLSKLMINKIVLWHLMQ